MDREKATALAERYGRTWQSGTDVAGFVDLLAEDVVYVARPIDETVATNGALWPGPDIRAKPPRAATTVR